MVVGIWDGGDQTGVGILGLSVEIFGTSNGSGASSLRLSSLLKSTAPSVLVFISYRKNSRVSDKKTQMWRGGKITKEDTVFLEG